MLTWVGIKETRYFKLSQIIITDQRGGNNDRLKKDLTNMINNRDCMEIVRCDQRKYTLFDKYLRFIMMKLNSDKF